jgi:hypothetical protein
LSGNEEIDQTGGSTGATNCVLPHPECHDWVHRQRLPVSKRVSFLEAFGRLELGEGKPSRPVLRGPGGRKAAWLLGSNPGRPESHHYFRLAGDTGVVFALISAHIVCVRELPLGRKFEFACQAPESCLIAYSVASREHHCRSQERVAFRESCLQPFEPGGGFTQSPAIPRGIEKQPGQ